METLSCSLSHINVALQIDIVSYEYYQLFTLQRLDATSTFCNIKIC